MCAASHSGYQQAAQSLGALTNVLDAEPLISCIIANFTDAWLCVTTPPQVAASWALAVWVAVSLVSKPQL